MILEINSFHFKMNLEIKISSNQLRYEQFIRPTYLGNHKKTIKMKKNICYQSPKE